MASLLLVSTAHAWVGLVASAAAIWHIPARHISSSTPTSFVGPAESEESRRLPEMVPLNIQRVLGNGTSRCTKCTHLETPGLFEEHDSPIQMLLKPGIPCRAFFISHCRWKLQSSDCASLMPNETPPPKHRLALDCPIASRKLACLSNAHHHRRQILVFRRPEVYHFASQLGRRNPPL